MDATDLPSGTVYPILRRIEEEGLVRARWERESDARREQRPPRRYYELTRPVTPARRSAGPIPRHGRARRTDGAPLETRMIFRLSLALLRLFARLVPARDRASGCANGNRSCAPAARDSTARNA